MERDTGGRFPATRLSVVESLRSDDAAQRQRACERLVALHWKPLYKYVRIEAAERELARHRELTRETRNPGGTRWPM